MRKVEGITGCFSGYNRPLNSHEMFFLPETEDKGFVCSISEMEKVQIGLFPELNASVGDWLVMGTNADGNDVEVSFSTLDEASAYSLSTFDCQHLYFSPSVGECCSKQWFQS